MTTAKNTETGRLEAHDQSPPVDLRGIPSPVKNPGTTWSIDGIANPQAEHIDREILDHPAASIGHLIRRRTTATPGKEAYRFRDVAENWVSLTWSQFNDRVQELSAGLLAVGLTKDSAAAIIAGTSIEWVEADISLMSIGVQSIAIYPTSIAEDISYILQDSGSRVAIVEDASQVTKLLAIRAEVPHLDQVFVIDPTFRVADVTGEASSSEEAEDIREWISPIAELRRLGSEYLAHDAEVVNKAIAQVDHDTVACLQYTSGTTGKPKGAIITHGAWVKNVASVCSIGTIYDDDLHFIWLPMAHLFGRFLVYLSADAGVTTAVDGRIDKIVENLQEVKPTLMGGAPRIFEKAYSAIMAQFEGDGVKAKLGKVSMSLALEDTEARLAGRRSSAWHRAKLAVADRVVLSKIRARSAGACACSSPAPRRLTRTSPSGSPPWACPSPRATDSPRAASPT
nr:AMP-binding protein [Corynebacterium lactis]